VPSVSLRLEPNLTSPRVARAAVASLLGRVGELQALPAAALIVSELVTNAVIHTRRPVELRLSYEADEHVLRGGVVDQSSTLPLPPTSADAIPEPRGLLIVDRLATTWGTYGDQDGKVVWFELRTENQPDA
jgi:sigma-B regulation protein RsbU (phosphoserine phosphatase)